MINYGVAPGGAIAMFAIVATSGRQFRVSEGDRILVDRVPAEVGYQSKAELGLAMLSHAQGQNIMCFWIR